MFEISYMIYFYIIKTDEKKFALLGQLQEKNRSCDQKAHIICPMSLISKIWSSNWIDNCSLRAKSTLVSLIFNDGPIWALLIFNKKQKKVTEK